MKPNPDQSASAAQAAAGSAPVWRHATIEDEKWIEDLQVRAFGPGRFARTAFRVRERFPIDPSLSLIAEIDGWPISSVWMTPISISGENGYLLGPLATEPKFRNRGAARLLVREASRQAFATGAAFVLLVGDEPYYGPLGFSRVPPYAITFPGPVDPGRVLVNCPDEELAARLKGPIAAPID